eukprot:6341485-Amphidinium_carterae.1
MLRPALAHARRAGVPATGECQRSHECADKGAAWGPGAELAKIQLEDNGQRGTVKGWRVSVASTIRLHPTVAPEIHG